MVDFLCYCRTLVKWNFPAKKIVFFQIFGIPTFPIFEKKWSEFLEFFHFFGDVENIFWRENKGAQNFFSSDGIVFH